MTAWQEQSYVLLPGFLSAADCRKYRSICDSVYAQWLQANPPGHTTNIAFLTDEHYFAENQSDLIALLNLIGGHSVTELLEQIAGEPVRFHNTQYFIEQVSDASPYGGAGPWHRDTQFEAPDLAQERARMFHMQSAHFRVAFEDDDHLEIVPGSGARWDTDEELALRRPPNTDVWARTPQTTSSVMPGARRIGLKAGDAVIFDAWSIHRGHYHITPVRRTLDVIYGWGPISEWAIPTQSCFGNTDLIAALSPDARAFFKRFVEFYEERWVRSARRSNSTPHPA